MYDLNQFKVPKDFRGKGNITVQLWDFVKFFLFKPSPKVLYGWRRFLLRLFGAKIGRGVIIRPSVEITYPWKFTIGDYSWIGDDVTLYTLGEINVGSNTIISQKSYICTGTHDYTKIDFPIYAMPIIIGNSCWLATDVFVGPGVKITDEVIVGARSSVYKNISVKGIYKGNPAQKT